MIWDFAITHYVFQTGQLIRENCRQKIFRFHALQWRRDFRTATKPRNRKRTRRVPAPANGEHRRIEQGLHEQVTHRCGMQIAKNFFQRKRMLRTERNYNRVVSSRRLQFKIERPTETLSQSQTPGAIDPTAEWRVKHKLHPA